MFEAEGGLHAGVDVMFEAEGGLHAVE